MSVRALLLALLGVLACNARALAQPHAGAGRDISLSLPDCEPASWRRELVRAALQLELESAGDHLNAQPTASGWQIAIESPCAPDDPVARIRVGAPDGSVRTRDVALADTPTDLHARTIALVAAEQLRVHVEAERPSAAKPHPPGLELALLPTLRLFMAARHALVGAELSLRVQRCSVAIAGLAGNFSDPLGSLSAGQATLALACELLRATAGDFHFSLGPRVAAGALWARAAGTPDSLVEPPLTAFIWDAGAVLAAHYTFGRFGVGVRLAGGYARGAQIRADSRTLADLTGLLVDAALGVSLAL